MSCWCLTTTIVSWVHKAVVLVLHVGRRVKKRNHLSLPQVFNINPESLLWGKLVLLHYSVPTSGTLDNRGVRSASTVLYITVNLSLPLFSFSNLEILLCKLLDLSFEGSLISVENMPNPYILLRLTLSHGSAITCLSHL
jgi:hypothetical protein